MLSPVSHAQRGGPTVPQALLEILGTHQQFSRQNGAYILEEGEVQ